MDETKRKELYGCIKQVIDPRKVLHMLIPSTEGYCYLLKHICMCDDVVFSLSISNFSLTEVQFVTINVVSTLKLMEVVLCI